MMGETARGQRSTRAGVSRRAFLVSALGTGSGALLLAACGPSVPATVPTSAAAPAAPSAAPSAALSVVLSPVPSPRLAPSPSPAVTGAPLTTLHVSYSEITPEIDWFWVTLEAGIFQKHGLDVEASQITSAEGMAAFLSGETDIGNTGGPDTLNAAANGATIVIVAVPNGVSPFRIYAPPAIPSMADLEGRSVGISQFGSPSELQMRLALQKAGMDPQSVTYLPTGSTQARTAALLQGTIQAAAANPLEGQTLVAQGMHVIYDLAALKEPWAEGTVTVRRDWMSQNSRVLQAYIDAIVEGTKLYKTDKTYAVSVMEKYFNTNDAAAMGDAYDAYVDLAPLLPTPTQAEFQTMQSLLAATNPAVANVDLSQLIDPAFVNSAQSRGLAN